VQLQPVVNFSRKVVVARRAVNQGAEVRPGDVHLVEMSFERFDRLGTADLARAIGQRAKRFVPPGTMIEPRNLETVPLVKRGQLVDVYSAVGGVTVVTVAKAVEPGGYGDAVELRDARRRGRPLIGVVTGPRRVEIRGDAGGTAERRLAVAGDKR
jgi:flagella basal body P-ring formation protein FlgA